MFSLKVNEVPDTHLNNHVLAFDIIFSIRSMGDCQEKHEFLMLLSRSRRRIFSEDDRIDSVKIGGHGIKGTTVGGDEF